MPPGQVRQMRGLEHWFSRKESMCQLGFGCCRPSTHHTWARSHVSYGQRCSQCHRGKKPCSLPSLQTETLRAGPTLSLTHCGLGEKDTHSSVSLGWASQIQARKQIFFKNLLSRGVSNTFLVYSGTFCSLQDQHKKPQPHLYTPLCYI